MNWLKQVLMYLPYVLQGVIAVEGAMKDSPGASKKQVIMDAVEAGAHVGATVPQDQVQVVSALVDTVVGTLNAVGVFQKKPAASA